MAAMGGSVEEAKRYIRNMKDQSRNRADKDSQKQRFKVYHQANKKKVNKKRMDGIENNKETEKANFKAYHKANNVGVNAKRMEPYEVNKEKANFRDYHEANKEPRKKYFVDWMKGGWWNWSSQYLTFPLRERSERVGLSACVKHGHVVQSTNCCWPVFGYGHKFP